MSQALKDIAAERRRQVEVEGWTTEHDDEHRDDTLALAATVYAMPAWLREWLDGNDIKVWPWDAAAWLKPKDRRSELVRAGALIAAEIDRMDRLAAREMGGPT